MRDQIKSCHICYVWDFQHFLVLVIEITTLNIIWMEFYFFEKCLLLQVNLDRILGLVLGLL